MQPTVINILPYADLIKGKPKSLAEWFNVLTTKEFDEWYKKINLADHKRTQEQRDEILITAFGLYSLETGTREVTPNANLTALLFKNLVLGFIIEHGRRVGWYTVVGELKIWESSAKINITDKGRNEAYEALKAEKDKLIKNSDHEGH